MDDPLLLLYSHGHAYPSWYLASTTFYLQIVLSPACSFNCILFISFFNGFDHLVLYLPLGLQPGGMLFKASFFSSHDVFCPSKLVAFNFSNNNRLVVFVPNFFIVSSTLNAIMIYRPIDFSEHFVQESYESVFHLPNWIPVFFSISKNWSNYYYIKSDLRAHW